MCGFNDFCEEVDSHIPDNVLEDIYPIDILYTDLLNEVQFKTLFNRAKEARIKKAETDIRKKPPTTTTTPEGYEKLDFNFKSKNSREGKRHKGFLVHDEGEVKQIYCNCGDFFFRAWSLAVEAGLSTYNPSKKYGRFDPRVYAPHYPEEHNKEQPLKVLPPPPNGRTGKKGVFLCKHLAALRSYI
jgi:hypothetical protein